MTNAEASTALDKATIDQMTWKQRVCAIVTRRICEEALRVDASDVWPDRIDFSDIGKADRNIIGTTFRNLRKQGVIAETGKNRRSESEGANGRRIFGYTLASRKLAESLVVRLGGVRFDKQQTLPLGDNKTE